MIKLTIQNGSNQEIRLFDKSILILGSRLPEADIVFSDPSLQPIHLKIVKEDNAFVIINIANDPFAAVNGIPFGKRTLSSGDQIEIGDMNVLFEITENLADTLETLDSDNLAKRLEKKIASPTSLSTQIPLENQEEIDLQLLDDFENWEMEYLSQEAEEESEKEAYAPIDKPKTVLSIKDAHFSENGEENETWYPESNVPQKEVQAFHLPPKNWLMIFSVVFLAFLTGSALLYLYIRNTSAREEIHAAQGVADIAMAMTHAQMRNLKPHNQNWADPDFIKSNLGAVLSDPHRLASYFDMQSYFTKNFYCLRIYTSSDLSQFLVIAQPMTSFWHVLIPQPAILVENDSMEIRRTFDLRSLNRLLADADSLENNHMREIDVLIKHEELIPLSKLCNELNTQDFSVPPALATINPGSENLIYNAPRYYRLGKPLIDAITKLGSGNGDIADRAFLHQETKALSQLNNLTLYTLEDEKTASHVKQTLLAYAPEASSIKIGWLSFDKKGDILCCHLPQDESTEFVAENSPVPQRIKAIDETDPLLGIIHDLQKERRERLAPYATYLIDLLKGELSQHSIKFDTEFEQLSTLFIKLCKQENLKFLQYTLPDEYQKRQSEFLEIARNEGFGDLLLKNVPKDPTFETLLKKIQVLTSSNLEYSGSLISMRQHVFNELEKLILAPQSHNHLNEDTEKAIRSLLDNDFITPEEKAFFLNEYSLLNSFHP